MTDLQSKIDSSQQDDNASTNNKNTSKLGYLCSAWKTPDMFYQSYLSSTSTDNSDHHTNTGDTSDDNIYQIRLPPLLPQDQDDEENDHRDEVLREIFYMISVANVLSLSCTLSSCAFIVVLMPSWPHVVRHYKDWMPHAILPFYALWWLFMIVVLNNQRAEHLRQYLNWTQASAIVMACTNMLIPHYNLFFSALALLAAVIFAFAKRFLIASHLKNERLKQRLAIEHARLQKVVDDHTDQFGNHRSAFLTTVSQEIQDVALMVITTLEQFSPAFILSNAHELLSACSLAVPIASISAINTTIRQVCHVSSHLQLLSKLTNQGWNINSAQSPLPELNLQEFDIGELLQNIGDALAGVASKLDVKLVIYHCDNNLHHKIVLGDEGAIRHALLNHLRNILECCTPGACIEVGLNVQKIKDPQKRRITFHITHTSSPAIRNASAAVLPNANLTARLLSYIHAECTIDQETNKNKTRFKFSFDLDNGKKDIFNKMFISKDSSLLKNHYANIKFSNEPSLKDLLQFIENIKGLKMVLHAPEQSIFAKHLTSCLASWNADISHVPVMNTISDETCSTASSQGEFSDQSNVTTPNVEPTPQQPRVPTTPPVPSPAIEEEHIHSIPPAFILIDDDIATLETKLNEFRLQLPASASALQAQHHGRRSHFHSKKASVHQQQNLFHQGTTAIIHFTSLTKYKTVRDTIQSYALLPSRDPFSMPRVVVVPKPAGPRRFLTALHTAWHNAVVEPHFSAIATTPSSPIPPAISMWIQREMNSNVTSPNSNNNSAGGFTPMGVNNTESISPGRRARPLSGIFNHHQSPPVTNTGDTNNYFTSQQPSSGAAVANNSRRRSANNPSATPNTTVATTATTAGPEDYLTAKHVPLMNALGVVSPAAAMAAAAAVSMATPGSSSTNPVSASATTPCVPMKEGDDHKSSSILSATMDLTAASSASASNELPSTLLNNANNTSVEVSSEVAVDENNVPESVVASAVPNNVVEPAKKKQSRTMSNFKLHKKKRKAKGTPFADVVSPPINVLIVEDNIINQAILSAWMKKHKIKFSVASNGKEAVDKWKTGGFHLILMDIQLPVMNGIEATKMIRSIEKEQKIGVLPMSSSFLRQQQAVAAATAATIVNNEQQPATYDLVETAAAEFSFMADTTDDKPSIFRSPVIIVALTASSLESDRHAALAAGCNDFLTKPVSLEWLEKKIIEWGCMQALIDFEGWRRWKKKSNAVVEAPAALLKKKEPLDDATKQQLEAEKKRIEALSKAPNKTGILLPGISNLTNKIRREDSASSSRKRSKVLLKPSKSDSDTQTTLHLQRSSSDTTAAAPAAQLSRRSRSISKEKKCDGGAQVVSASNITQLDDAKVKKTTKANKGRAS